MLLLIDAGNTRVKWALATPDERRPGFWQATGAASHAEVSGLAGAWLAAVSTVGTDHTISRVLIANVAGPALAGALSQALAAVDASLSIEWFASVPTRAGVRNGYRDPAQLGCDRFAALIGARALFPARRLIVATCGTATTVDALDADGSFLGGMILPGLGVMAASLAGNTAQLPQLSAAALSVRRPSVFADHTEAAIIAGCLNAQAGAIARALDALGALNTLNRSNEFDATLPDSSAECVLSGGAAEYIAPSLPFPHHPVQQLVLIGLHAAAIDAAHLNVPFTAPSS